MEHEVPYRPSHLLLRVSLSQDESIAAEAGAMVSMSGGIEMDTNARRGVFEALKRSVLGGEGLVCRLTGPRRIRIQTRSSTGVSSD